MHTHHTMYSLPDTLDFNCITFCPFLFLCLSVSLSLYLCLCLSHSSALDDDGKLTNPLGMQMAEFPLNPMFARMLLLSGMMNTHYSCYYLLYGNFV